jgi:hypothetical protein
MFCREKARRRRRYRTQVMSSLFLILVQSFKIYNAGNYAVKLTLSVLTDAALLNRAVIVILIRGREGGINEGDIGEGGFEGLIFCLA